MNRIFALSAVCALMTACAETGTSTSSSSFPEITDYDYVELSAESASESLGSAFGGVAESSSGEGSDLASDGTVNSAALSVAQKVASDYISASLQKSRADIETGSGNCLDGGTLSIEISGTLENAGDWVQAYFNNCLEDGVLMDGGLRLSIHASTLLESDLSANYQSLSVTENSETATLNGDLRMAWQRSGTITTAAISSNTLNMDSSEDGHTVIEDLSIVSSSDNSSQITTLESSYEMASDALDGRISFETLQVLSYADDDDYPGTGVVRLSGANDTTLTLNADTGDLSTVLLSVFDGAVTSSDVVDWSSIENSDLTELADF
ncbi:MAG: hypothetical protein ACPGSC_10065 [Granulosicoccaceae bacterium]